MYVSETVIMKKAIKNIMVFFSIIHYCFSLSLKASEKYFFIRIILNLVSLAAPFVIITITRSLIDLLVDNIRNASVLSAVMQSFLTLSLLLLGFNILNKAIETMSTYYAGLHSDTMNSATRYIIMKKAAELDLSFFDSNAFYNEMNDVNANSPLITHSAFLAMDLIRYLVQFLIAFVCLFQFSFILPFVFVISVIPSTIVRNKQLEAVYSFQREHMSEERKMQYASDVLLSQEFAKDVRVYNIFSLISEKFLNIWKTLFSKKRKITLRYTKSLLVLSALPEAMAAVILFVLGLSVIRGTHTMGDYSFFKEL